MLTKITLEVQVSSFSDTFSANFPHRSVISHIFYVNPPTFGKLYPFGVRFQHKTKQRPRNVDRFRHRNRTKPVPFLGWFHGIVPILRPCTKLWARILQHFQMYTCTFFVAMPSQKPFTTIWQCTSMFAWSGMRRFRPTDEYVVLHIFKYAVSAKG